MGALDLAPWYPDPGKKIGEVWFEADLPLLVKFVFTSERLSVQVHPDDAFAAAHEKSLGKTEMWYVLRADPGRAARSWVSRIHHTRAFEGIVAEW